MAAVSPLVFRWFIPHRHAVLYYEFGKIVSIYPVVPAGESERT